MKTAHLCLAPLLALCPWLLDCGGGPGPCSGGGPTPAGGAPSGFGGLATTPLFLENKPASVSFSLPAQATCTGLETFGRLERAEVLDSKNSSVASAVRSLDATTSAVEFQASAPGWYHVTAFFEPNLGLGQLDPLVLKDQTSTLLAVLPGEKCAEVGRLQGGAVFCGSHVYRAGVRLASLPPFTAAASAGNALWTLEGAGDLHRYTDPGSGDLTQMAPLSGASSASLPKLLATEDQLVLVADGRASLFGVGTGGALSRIGTPVSLDAGVSHPFRVADILFAVSSAPTSPGDTSVCAFQISSTGLAAGATPCQVVSGAAWGVSQGGLWTAPAGIARGGPVTERPNVLNFAAPVGQSLQLKGTSALPADFNLIGASPSLLGAPSVAVVDPRAPAGAGAPWLLTRALEGNVIFERYSTSSGCTFTGASDDLAWEQCRDGGTRIFHR